MDGFKNIFWKGKLYSSKKYGVEHKDGVLKLEKEAKEKFGMSVDEMRANKYQVEHILAMSWFNLNDKKK